MSFFNFGKEKLPAGVTKAKIEDNSTIPTPDGVIDENGVSQLMANDGVNICSIASSVCWDVKIPDQYDKRSEYISRRTATGHGSVTEHSNNVFFLIVPNSELQSLVEVLDTNRYLHTCVKFSKKYNHAYMIIGGSWRAWNYLITQSTAYRSMHPEHVNHIMDRLLNGGVYTFCDWSGFADLLKNHAIPNNFSNVNMTAMYNNPINLNQAPIEISKNVDCYGIDNINRLINMLTEVCPEPELFTVADIFEFCTCTILFKNMSRIITQQLVRHRNAITQESQRYVDRSNAGFNSPAKFKDIYNPDFKYPITFGRSSQKMTLQEIGDNIINIYGQLFDKNNLGSNALVKEDARGYLPSNTQCERIFITFTWDYLFHFLRLREDKHAQAEIRMFATDIGNWFADLYPEFVCMYRPDAGDASWVNYPIPNKEMDDTPMDKESFIEVIENSMKEETIQMESSENKKED